MEEISMLNAIWACMILIGVVYAALTGRMDAVTGAAIDSAGEAISLCITMAGVVAMWMGFMEIAKEAGLIDFSEDAAVIERKVRAYDPWPGTYTFLNGKTFKILKAAVNGCTPQGDSAADAAPGQVAYSDARRIMIKTGAGLIEPLMVQMEGKRAMSMEEFLRGRKIEQGYIFG